MPRRVQSLVLILGLVIAWGGTAGAAGMSSRYLDVQVEVFRSAGLFGLGRYEPLDARFVAMDIGALTAEDAASAGRARDFCTAATGTECAALARLDYTFVRRFAAEPVLGSNYRVVLTNKTEADLGVVLAIDGLNTNGGSPATGTAADRKWILGPRQTARISGWQVSTDQALAFRFETPSRSQADDAAARGTIRVDVYLPQPGSGDARGTGAGNIIDQPTALVPFAPLTSSPVDVFDINYARTSVSLGILCGETGGVGVRITRVVEGTIAELRGLRAGDVVTHINAVAVNTCKELSAFLATKRPGDRVVLKVHREDRDFLLTLEIEE